MRMVCGGILIMTLDASLRAELRLAYHRYDVLCDDGVDQYDDRRARLDAYITQLERLLTWE